jgi:hypothetical protein
MDESKLNERDVAASQVDAFVQILSKRYGLEPMEVVEAVKWVREHKDSISRLKHAGWLALIGILISSALLALWEGVRTMVIGKH